MYITVSCRIWNCFAHIIKPDMQVLVGLNKRNPEVFDMYRVDLVSGELTLDTENPGDVLGWLTDAKFQIRGAISMNPTDGSTTFRTRETLDRSHVTLTGHL